MTYNIFDPKAPAMPRPSKGTEIVNLLLMNASKDMRQPLLPMAFPALAAHLNSDVELMYSDNKYYEIGAGQMGHIIGNSGTGKNQLTFLVEAICRDFSAHDEMEYKRLADWSRQMKTLGGNAKNKPERPSVYFTFPPSDITNAAFTQNADSLEQNGGRTMYLNLPEVGLADKISGGHRAVSQMIRQCYDVSRGGQLRATSDGITANPRLRLCMTLSSTPDDARAWYKRDMVNGTFGRITTAYVPRGERKGRIPRQGTYDEDYLAKLDQYLLRLSNAKGRFVVKPLNKVADQLATQMCDLANLADSDELFELSHRSIFSAWKKAAVLWILNDQSYTRSIGDFMTYFCYYDLWAKLRVFNDMLALGEPLQEETQKRGPKNFLQELPNTFNETQLEAIRVNHGKNKEGTKHQISVWSNRGFIEYSAQTGFYTKTELYLKGKS